MILLIGSSGIISNHLQSGFNRHSSQFIASTSNRNKSITKNTFYFDLRSTETSIKDCVNLKDIEAAIICANIFSESKKTSKFLYLYEQSFSRLFKTLNSYNIFTIFLSSNRIFNGLIKSPDEETEPCPYIDDTYGLCKYVAERELICSGHSNYAIIRFSKIIDPNFGLFDEWISQLKLGKKINPLKMPVAPISLDLAGIFINRVLATRAKGIYHLSAEIDTTYVKIAKHIVHALDLPIDMVVENKLGEKGNYQRLKLYDSLSMKKTLTLIEPPKAFDAVDKYLEKFSH